MIDAAVSGSTPQAKEGKLVIFVGGEMEIYQQCEPILNVMGQQIHHMAPAYKAKLANVEHEQYPENFALASMRKDFSLIMRLAAELSVAMPSTAAALAQGHDEDYSVILRFMEQMSGIEKLS